MTGRSTARSGRFHFSPPSSYLSIPSVPSLLNYFSCLIGLSVEDVPSDCHSEIAMFSKWVSLGVLRPGLLLLVKPPQKMLSTRLYPEPLFPHV